MPAPKIKTITGEPPTCPEDIVISETLMNQRRTLVGYRIKLDKRHGEGNWGDKELKRALQEDEYERYKQLEALKIQPEDFDDRLAQYLNAFDNPTPNDIESLRQLVTLEMQMEANREVMQQGTKDIDRLSDWVKLQGVLMKEHRAIQQVLGIERKGRKTRTEKALDLVLDQIERAREFIEAKLIMVEHCNILMGWILNDFDELPWEYRARCPKCGKEVIYSGGDMEALKEALGDEAWKKLEA